MAESASYILSCAVAGRVLCNQMVLAEAVESFSATAPVDNSSAGLAPDRASSRNSAENDEPRTSDPHDAEGSPLLLFDLGGFLEVQDKGEAHALARQVMLVYASNKRARRPFRLGLCGVPVAGNARQAGDSSTAGVLFDTLERLNFRNWGPPSWVSIHSEPPWEAFPDRELVYLSADAEENLGDIEHGAHAEAYVMGGVVDRCRKPGASLERANAAGVRAVRLPTDGVFETPNKPDALSCLACAQAMLAYHNGARPSWGDAFAATTAMHCAPLKKYVVWRGGYAHLNKEGRSRPPHITTEPRQGPDIM